MKIIFEKKEAEKILEAINAAGLQDEKLTKEIKIQAVENGKVEVLIESDFFVKTVDLYKMGINSFKAIMAFVKLHLDLIKAKAEIYFPPVKVEEETKKEAETSEEMEK